jgi:predicted cobalt transporter CbtA
VPGVAAADVALRQVWWFAIVAMTAAALWMIAFGRSFVLYAFAVLLLLAPHVVGAPEPAQLAGTVPPEIAALFAARALGLGLVAWVMLGAFAGYFWQKEGARAGTEARV